mgnify:CR=1 FL=1|jgi:hypothetical protein
MSWQEARVWGSEGQLQFLKRKYLIGATTDSNCYMRNQTYLQNTDIFLLCVYLTEYPIFSFLQIKKENT